MENLERYLNERHIQFTKNLKEQTYTLEILLKDTIKSKIIIFIHPESFQFKIPHVVPFNFVEGQALNDQDIFNLARDVIDSIEKRRVRIVSYGIGPWKLQEACSPEFITSYLSPAEVILKKIGKERNEGYISFNRLAPVSSSGK